MAENSSSAEVSSNDVKEPIVVRLKTLKREEFQITVDDTSLVSELKKKIELEKKQLLQLDGSEALQLVCAGKVLKDDEQVKGVYDQKNKAAFMVCIAKKPVATASKPAAAAAANDNKTAVATGDNNTTAASTTNTPGSAAATNTSATAQSGNAAASATTTGTAAPAAAAAANPHQQAIEQNEPLIKNIVEMGYPRAQVEQALILSNFNGDRAVQLLCDGMMPLMAMAPGAMMGAGAGGGIEAELDFDPNDPAALFAAAAAAGIPLGGDDDDDDDDDADDEGGGAGGAGGLLGAGAQGLNFLRAQPQFEQMRQLIQQNPAMLPQLIQQIGATNPELLQLIQGNQQEFIQLLNSAANAGGAANAPAGAGGAAAAAPQAGGAAGGGANVAGRRDNRVVINLTQQDRDAIDRLKNMGFEEALVVQAYFACDKDENAAANFLLSQLGDD